MKVSLCGPHSLDTSTLLPKLTEVVVLRLPSEPLFRMNSYLSHQVGSWEAFWAAAGRKPGDAVSARRINASRRKIDNRNFVFIEQTPSKGAPSSLAGQVRVFLRLLKGNLRVRLSKTLRNVSMPGADLPDLVNAFILGNTASGQELVFIAFRGTATGPLRAPANLGPEGTPGRCFVVQTGFFLRSHFMGATADGFPAELVELRRIGR